MRPWPDAVQPPDTLAWRSSAARWLATVVPGYTDHRLTAEPLLLAHAAWWTVTGILDGTRRAYTAAPADLDDWLARHDIGHLRGLYTRNGRDLRQLLAEITAVRDALLRDARHRAQDAARGQRPTPDGTAWRRAAEQTAAARTASDSSTASPQSPPRPEPAPGSGEPPTGPD